LKPVYKSLLLDVQAILMDAFRREKPKVVCPEGHHLKGDISLVGQEVCCPVCKLRFVFSPSANDGDKTLSAHATSCQSSPIRSSRLSVDLEQLIHPAADDGTCSRESVAKTIAAIRTAFGAESAERE
jgi:hypothetical protein